MTGCPRSGPPPSSPAGLRELRDDADTPQYLGLVAAGSTNPTARVEYALRADELLTEPQVRQIMEYYLAVRMRRYGRTFQPSDPAPATETRTDRIVRSSTSGNPVGVAAGHGTTIGTVRPVSRSSSREPGRY